MGLRIGKSIVIENISALKKPTSNTTYEIFILSWITLLDKTTTWNDNDYLSG